MGNKCCSKRQPEDSFNSGYNKSDTTNVWKPGKQNSIDSRYTPDPVIISHKLHIFFNYIIIQFTF
jgi:hypothetical protein